MPLGSVQEPLLNKKPQHSAKEPLLHLGQPVVNKLFSLIQLFCQNPRPHHLSLIPEHGNSEVLLKENFILFYFFLILSSR